MTKEQAPRKEEEKPYIRGWLGKIYQDGLMIVAPATQFHISLSCSVDCFILQLNIREWEEDSKPEPD